MNPGQSDMGTSCLQYRLPKSTLADESVDNKSCDMQEELFVQPRMLGKCPNMTEKKHTLAGKVKSMLRKPGVCSK